MKKPLIYCSFIQFAIFLSGCSDTAKVNMKSAEFVDEIYASGVTYKFEGKDILQLELDFHFINDLAPDFEVNSDEHRVAVYKKIIEGATFHAGNEEIMSFYGYWPEKSGKNFAKSMTIFYVVPKNRPENSLEFSYDGKVLGDPEYHFTYTNFP